MLLNISKHVNGGFKLLLTGMCVRGIFSTPRFRLESIILGLKYLGLRRILIIDTLYLIFYKQNAALFCLNLENSYCVWKLRAACPLHTTPSCFHVLFSYKLWFVQAIYVHVWQQYNYIIQCFFSVLTTIKYQNGSF